MLSVSRTPAVKRTSITAASVVRFAELVKKIETSPASSNKKRRNSARKRLRNVIKEQRRNAKVAKLRAVAVTLTYRDSTAYSKKHISRFIDNLRDTLKRAGYALPYVWVLERGGQLHYHLTLWLPRGYQLDPDRLAKWWCWGTTWVEACRSVGAWGRYMAKFISTAVLPKSARLYGYGGLDDAGKTAVSRASLPRWLLVLLPTNGRARRHPGGGWIDMTTGVVHHSPYIWTPWGAKLRSVSPPACH